MIQVLCWKMRSLLSKEEKEIQHKNWKISHLLRQSPTQPLHFLTKSQHPQTCIVPAENNINNKKYIHTQNPFFALCIETYQSLHGQPHKVTKNLHLYLLQLNHFELTAQDIYTHTHTHIYMYVCIYIHLHYYCINTSKIIIFQQVMLKGPLYENKNEM